MTFFPMTATKSLLAVCAVASLVLPARAADKPPAVGDTAKDFTLSTIGGHQVTLSKLTAEGPVVLVVLRGYPGYQCPLCTRQVGEFIGKKKEFVDAGAKVVFVYPGASESLQERAAEFFKGSDAPRDFQYVLDPNYTFTNAYNLRWNAPKETAYPSTFVINKDRKITFAKISKTHGDRAKVSDVLAALGQK